MGTLHYNRLLGHYYLNFCDSVSCQKCKVEKQIFFKNMKDEGIISHSENLVRNGVHR